MLAASPKDVPDSAIAEVIRRGDLVTLAGDGLHGATTDPFVRVMAVPEDDSHKWFISIVTSLGCQACESLKAAWKTSPHLLAFARPEDAKESWAHWGVYRPVNCDVFEVRRQASVQFPLDLDSCSPLRVRDGRTTFVSLSQETALGYRNRITSNLMGTRRTSRMLWDSSS